jgi:hypothetical protein
MGYLFLACVVASVSLYVFVHPAFFMIMLVPFAVMFLWSG